MFRQFQSGDAVDRIQVQNINTAVKTNIGLIYATCRSVSCEGMDHDVNLNVPYDDCIFSLSLVVLSVANPKCRVRLREMFIAPGTFQKHQRMQFQKCRCLHVKV